MSFNKKVLFPRGLTMLSFFCAVILAANIYTGCGGNSDEAAPGAILTVAEAVIAPDDGTLVVDNDDSYYIALEQKLNEELDISRAPDKCAAQGLTKIILNFTTDEIQTCSTYDISKISATAYFSDKTAEIITPAWSIYSGGGTLDGTIYTATNKPAIIVFKAIYSENGISKLALFRLTVTGLISISLNKTTDEIQLPATYDLLTELIVTAKLSNGTTKAIVKGDPNLKWTLSSGAGTLVDGVYTPSAKVENATFTANYTENGVTRAAKFKLKVAGLSSLILSKTTDEVNSCETYDLASKIIVSNKLSNGTINDITSSPNLTWALSSGSGILDGKVYTAPAKAETAVFTASYTEAGITKTAQFRLKVTGLSSVVLDKTTDEIMLPATYDLASEVNAVAKFSDGESKSVDLIWTLSLGSGNLSGSLYTPTAQAETAVFTGSYTENGITKTAQFKLKVIGLSSLTLSKTTDEVVSCATYDLSQIIVSDKLSNGTVNNITNSTFWKLVTGFGTLSGTTYTAPARAETAAFTANYTEAGITKTAQFRLKVIALASIKLSKATDEAQILAQYDLASNIAVTAKLSNGQTKPVSGNDPNLKWTLSYGSGILSGTLYTPPERIETAVLTATYTENGVAQSAQLRLKSSATLRGKIELAGLTQEQTTDSIRIGQTYDLSKLIAIAKFVDKTTAEVSLSWIVSSGGGSITGTTYTAPNNVATVKLMGTFTALDGSARSVYFTLTIYGNEIYGNQGVVTNAGARFRLASGVIFEIPPNSVDLDGKVSITETSNFPCKQPNINVYNINAENQIYCAIIKIPVKSETCQNDYTMAYISDTSCPENPSSYYTCYPKGIIDDTVCVFIVGDDPTINLSPVHNVNRAEQTNPKVNLGKAIVKVELFDEEKAITCANILNNPNKKEKKIKWPFYLQAGPTCYAANWLMLLKGYKADLSELGFANIPLIIKKTGMGPEEGVKLFKEINWLLGKANSSYFTNSDIKYEDKTFDILQRTLKPNYTTDPRVFTYNVINSLDNNNPVMLNMVIHSMLIVGYSYNGTANITKDDIRNEVTYNNLTFYVHNPNTAPFCEYKLTDITREGDGRDYNKHSTYDFSYYFLDSATSSQDSPNLYSIHIPKNQGIVFKNDSGDFGRSIWNFNNSSNIIDPNVWNFISSSGCYWQNNNKIAAKELNVFNKITLNDIPVYNAFDATSCKLMFTIFKGETDDNKINIVYKNYYCNSYLNSLSVATNNLKTYSAILPTTLAYPEYYFTFDNEINYRDDIESKISSENSKFLIQVALVKKATNDPKEKLDIDFDIDKNRILDKFTIGFIHRKLWISGPIKDGNKNIFKCMLGNDDVTNQMEFSYYQLVEGNEILTDLTTNSVIPNVGGTYKVVATALDTAPEYLKNRTAELDNVPMASLLHIIPQKNKIGIFEETMLYAKNNDQPVDPLWSIFGNTSDFLLGALEISPFDSTVYVAPKFNAAPERTMQTTSA
ncbi:MAG TPA: hypothetical protein DEA62_04955, partial [Coxiellaceae bacterium]|nr:hypothetical protein [Coxiellaceae bacterium]